MTSLSLPPPRNLPSQPTISRTDDTSSDTPKAPPKTAATAPNKPQPPSYEDRCRSAAALASAKASSSPPSSSDPGKKPKLFVPRTVDDFGDGGAFPEIHVAQYPRHMGNPHGAAARSANAMNGATRGAHAASSRALVNVEVDEKGKVNYDAIVKGGTNADKIVYTKHSDLRGGQANPQDVALPTKDEEAEEAAKTQAALDAILGKKMALDKPSGSAIANAQTSIGAKTDFITYTPRPDAPGYNPAAAKRVVQMVPAQVDPMAPPKHKHIKAPAGPAEDLVPVLHKPAQKLTKEERDAWNVPACISNWKNTRGYVIPLDKRLAADGRGLQEHSINSNFATLSESLYVAERQARQEVRLRAQVQKKLALDQAEAREAELRDLARQARQQRGGPSAAGAGAGANSSADAPKPPPKAHAKGQVSDSGDSSDDAESVDRPPRDNGDDIPSEDAVAARQREKLRQERKRERERELRMEQNMELKKQKFEDERDVSEKIALGVHTGTGGGGGDEVDSRLYNQSAGMDSGFGRDDDYNTYSQPLFKGNAATSGSTSIYRPTRGTVDADEQYKTLAQGTTTKFQPSKGFAGAEGGTGSNGTGRSAPVQFEKGKRHD